MLLSYGQNLTVTNDKIFSSKRSEEEIVFSGDGSRLEWEYVYGNPLSTLYFWRWMTKTLECYQFLNLNLLYLIFYFRRRKIEPSYSKKAMFLYFFGLWTLPHTTYLHDPYVTTSGLSTWTHVSLCEYSCFCHLDYGPLLAYYVKLLTSDGFLIFDICTFIGLLKQYLTHKTKGVTFLPWRFGIKAHWGRRDR